MRTVLTNARPYGEARSTTQRRTIADAVPETAFTVADLAAAVSRVDPAIGLATVYRAVAAMEASGWLTRVGDISGTARYVRCAEEEHHHHAVCTECGRVEHTPCPVAVSQGVAPPGFTVTSHELTLYGVCQQCLAADIPPGGETE